MSDEKAKNLTQDELIIKSTQHLSVGIMAAIGAFALGLNANPTESMLMPVLTAINTMSALFFITRAWYLGLKAICLKQ
jgi:hypothetical protein